MPKLIPSFMISTAHSGTPIGSVEPTALHSSLPSLLISLVTNKSFSLNTSVDHPDITSEANLNHPLIEPKIVSLVMH